MLDDLSLLQIFSLRICVIATPVVTVIYWEPKVFLRLMQTYAFWLVTESKRVLIDGNISGVDRKTVSSQMVVFPIT